MPPGDLVQSCCRGKVGLVVMLYCNSVGGVETSRSRGIGFQMNRKLPRKTEDRTETELGITWGRLWAWRREGTSGWRHTSPLCPEGVAHLMTLGRTTVLEHREGGLWTEVTEVGGWKTGEFQLCDSRPVS